MEYPVSVSRGNTHPFRQMDLITIPFFCHKIGYIFYSQHPIFFLNQLFSDHPVIACDDAADANDDGNLDISDALRTLLYLYSAGDPKTLPAPAATTLGPDPTEDSLGCSL